MSKKLKIDDLDGAGPPEELPVDLDTTGAEGVRRVVVLEDTDLGLLGPLDDTSAGPDPLLEKENARPLPLVVVDAR